MLQEIFKEIENSAMKRLIRWALKPVHQRCKVRRNIMSATKIWVEFYYSERHWSCLKFEFQRQLL